MPSDPRLHDKPWEIQELAEVYEKTLFKALLFLSPTKRHVCPCPLPVTEFHPSLTSSPACVWWGSNSCLSDAEVHLPGSFTLGFKCVKLPEGTLGEDHWCVPKLGDSFVFLDLISGTWSFTLAYSKVYSRKQKRAQKENALHILPLAFCNPCYIKDYSEKSCGKEAHLSQAFSDLDKCGTFFFQSYKHATDLWEIPAWAKDHAWPLNICVPCLSTVYSYSVNWN